MLKVKAYQTYRGQSVTISEVGSFGSPVGSPLTLVFTLAAERNSATKLLTATPEFDGEHVSITLTASQVDLAPARYWWDIWQTDDGEEQVVAIGYLDVTAVVRLPEI